LPSRSHISEHMNSRDDLHTDSGFTLITRTRRLIAGASLTCLFTAFPGVCQGVAHAKSHHTVPVVKSIRVTGSSVNPTITITGTGFGSRPQRSPQRGTSNLGRCGTIAGHTGFDYRAHLWMSDSSQDWSAGNTALKDCIGLRLSVYSADEVRFRLGSFYAQQYGQRNHLPQGRYAIRSGDTLLVAVAGTVTRLRAEFPRSDSPSRELSGGWSASRELNSAPRPRADLRLP
jgi:hypothetical protein